MSYSQLIEMVAREEHTTPAEVDKGIREAIDAAGYKGMPPELFISLCAAKVKSQLNKQ